MDIFESMLANEEPEAPISPRELYEQLPDKALGYGYLRDVQAQVLTAWHERRDEQDLVLKVNTGGGKTIDGLVILQSYLNEGLGPALFVAPDNYLVKQVIKEAEKIKIPTVTNPEDARYLRGEAIAVVNASRLFNGKTIFSDNRASPVPIGSVVIDDAHAAIATMRQKLSLRIPRPQEGATGASAYEDLLDLFESDIKQQFPDALLDLRERSNSALVRVPFWAWRNKVEQARAIMRPYTKDETTDLFFAWPAVTEILHLCRVVFSNNEVTITPPCPPIKHVTSFAEAKRRVYLSATLADDSVLVTDFGANPESVRKPINPLTAGDIGERMILAPQEINPSIRTDEIRNAIVDLSKSYNTVVLVPSNAAMRAWPQADRTARAHEVEAVVEELKSGKHVGLVVLANKYDGIDLPQSACRILVLDGLPTAFSGEERLDSQLTSQESGVDDRQVQRIEQGMGRGVRSNEDHCVVFLIGSRLSQLTTDPRTVPQFSPATRAQLKLSHELASRVEEQPLSQIMAVAKRALTRDAGWVKLAKQRLSKIAPEPGVVSHHAVARREAFEAASLSDYQRASKLLSDAAETSTRPREQGWLMEQQATYIDHSDPERAQVILAAARTKNPRTTRPLSGVTYHMLKGTDQQAISASTHLGDLYGNPAALRLGFEAVLEDLVFDPLRTDEFEHALHLLGHILGLASQRPEHEMGSGPDNLWALGANKFWVIEAKSGATSKSIGKRDAGQLGQSLQWFTDRYNSEARAVPVMVHPEVQLYRDASAPAGMMVLTPRNLARLVESVRTFSSGVAALGTWTDTEALQSLLKGHKLTSADLESYLVPVRAS